MSVEILSGDNGSVMFDSVTMEPLYKVFPRPTDAERFCEWLGGDPRPLSWEMLDEAVARWRRETKQ